VGLFWNNTRKNEEDYGELLIKIEAMKPTVDSDTRIKIQCTIEKGRSNQGGLSCTGQRGKIHCQDP